MRLNGAGGTAVNPLLEPKTSGTYNLISVYAPSENTLCCKPIDLIEDPTNPCCTSMEALYACKSAGTPAYMQGLSSLV